MITVIKIHPHLSPPPLRGRNEGEGEGCNLADFVLSPFNKEEKEQLKEILKKVAAVVEFLLEAGMEETMSRLGTIS